MSPSDERDLPRTEPESHAERLGCALRRLAAELVDERRKVAELRREVAELRSWFEAPQAAQARYEVEPGGASSRPGTRGARPRDATRRRWPGQTLQW